MGGEHRHHGGSGHRGNPARHRHVEAEGACRADHLAAVEGTNGSLSFEGGIECLESFICGVETEGESQQPAKLRAFIFRDGADDQSHNLGMLRAGR